MIHSSDPLVNTIVVERYHTQSCHDPVLQKPISHGELNFVCVMRVRVTVRALLRSLKPPFLALSLMYNTDFNTAFDRNTRSNRNSVMHISIYINRPKDHTGSRAEHPIHVLIFSSPHRLILSPSHRLTVSLCHHIIFSSFNFPFSTFAFLFENCAQGALSSNT